MAKEALGPNRPTRPGPPSGGTPRTENPVGKPQAPTVPTPAITGPLGPMPARRGGPLPGGSRTVHGKLRG